jgi:hypothetical protein
MKRHERTTVRLLIQRRRLLHDRFGYSLESLVESLAVVTTLRTTTVRQKLTAPVFALTSANVQIPFLFAHCCASSFDTFLFSYAKLWRQC